MAQNYRPDFEVCVYSKKDDGEDPVAHEHVPSLVERHTNVEDVHEAAAILKKRLEKLESEERETGQVPGTLLHEW